MGSDGRVSWPGLKALRERVAGTSNEVVLSEWRFEGDIDTFAARVIESNSHLEYKRVCEHCAKPFMSGQKKGRFCSGACRLKAHRAKQAEA